MKRFSRGRCVVTAVVILILAAVLSVGALFVCAFAGLDMKIAPTVSLCVFVLVSAAAFLYLILTPPKEEKVVKVIGFAGLTFDIILVPVYAAYIFFGG